jgi:hypothetical protein
MTKKKRHKGAFSMFAMEAEVGIEPAYTALQAADKLARTTTYTTCHPVYQLWPRPNIQTTTAARLLA